MGEQHYKRVSEKINVYLYFLRGFFIMKVVENIPQNARNCTTFKNFLVGGGHPPKPPINGSQLRCSRHAANHGMYIHNHKYFIVGPPPLRNPAYAPDGICQLTDKGL